MPNPESQIPIPDSRLLLSSFPIPDSRISNPGAQLTLQRKLLLASLATLLLPVAGWLYLRQMDTVLRQSQQRSLVASAQMLARTVNTWVRLTDEPSWHVQHSVLPLVVDGYGDDWNRLAAWAEPVPGNGHLLLGEHAGELYLLLSVDDSSADRRKPDQSVVDADHLDLWLGMRGARCHYQLAAVAPGVIQAMPLNKQADKCFKPLRAQWQENGSGYRVELRLPATARLAWLGVRAVDASKPGNVKPVDRRPLQRFSRDLSQRFADLLPDAGRVRLIDRDGWVVASAGRLGRAAGAESPGWLSTAAYQALVAHDMSGSAALDQVAAQLEAPEVWQALSGIPAVSWRTSVTRARVTLAAVVPLPGSGDPRGAVVLEQSVQAMPLLSNRGLLWLLLGSLALLVLAGAVLAGFALRLGSRLRQLRDAVQNAAARPGQDVSADQLPGSDEKDELGDLARGHQQLLHAVSGYTDYLRTLASKLSHELNTPMAIVKSSLDNLDQAELPEAQQTYLKRAREGSERLTALVRAMGAAGRIEQAIGQGESEDFDLRLLVAGCADGYRLLAGSRQLELQLPAGAVRLHGAPDLVVQALDKLFDNALSFTPEEGWIRLSLRSEGEDAVIDIANQGPLLPEGGKRLFDSLVSVREPSENRRAPHLGLGLYIVRMIAAQHDGEIWAENLEGGEGVVFHLRLRGIARQSIAPVSEESAQ